MGHSLMVDLHSTVLARAGTTRQAYSPHGVSLGKASACLAFHGQPRELPAGRYLLGNGKRLYMPSLMRFAMPDRQSPFGRGGRSAYAYCLGDPVNRLDPGGEVSFFALTKHIVWLGARAKAILSGVRGIKLAGEAAKWSGRAGSALATLGVPGGGTITRISGSVALSVKAFTTGKALLGYLKPASAARRASTSASRGLQFSGSLGQLVPEPELNTDFSPFVGYLLRPDESAAARW